MYNRYAACTALPCRCQFRALICFSISQMSQMGLDEYDFNALYRLLAEAPIRTWLIIVYIGLYRICIKSKNTNNNEIYDKVMVRLGTIVALYSE